MDEQEAHRTNAIGGKQYDSMEHHPNYMLEYLEDEMLKSVRREAVVFKRSSGTSQEAAPGMHHSAESTERPTDPTIPATTLGPEPKERRSTLDEADPRSCQD